jgi:hypothetical protein
MSDLETLKDSERILAFSYWENFKWHKDAAQSMGGDHPKVRQIGLDVEEIRKDWINVQIRISEIESPKPNPVNDCIL